MAVTAAAVEAVMETGSTIIPENMDEKTPRDDNDIDDDDLGTGDTSHQSE